MSAANDEKKADQARSALLKDIHDLKGAGEKIVSKATSTLPWVIGGAVGLIAVGMLATLKPAHRAFGPPRRSLLGKATRAIGLAAVGMLTRRWVAGAVNKVLPEEKSAAAA
jgi:hypothetical protein